MKIAEIYVKLQADIRGLQTNLTKAQKSLQGVQKHTKKISKTINKDLTPSMSRFGKLMKSTAGKIAMGFGLGMGVTGILLGTKRAVTDMVTKGREFEKEWANVTTMLSISSNETKILKDELLRLSPTLGDTTKLAEGMYQVLSASIEPAKAIRFLGEAAKAAKAGVTDTKVAVDALTTVINAYGMAAEDVTDVSDIMFQVVKSGKITYEELSASLGTVVPVASQVGVSFEDVAAATATLTRQGIDAQTATMQLRQVFMAILKPGDQAKKMAEDLKIEFSLLGLKSKGLVGFLKDLKEKTGGNTEKMAALVPNVRALTGVLALAGEQADAFAEDQIKMLNAAGATEEAFRKQMKTVDFWIETAKTSVDKFKIAFWDGFTTPLKEGIQSSEDLEKATQELITTFQELGKLVGNIVVPAYKGLMTQLNKVLDVNKGMKLLMDGMILAIKNKQIPTLKNAAKAWADNYIEQKKAKEWADKNKKSIANLVEKLTGLKIKLESTGEAIKTWKDILRNLGIKTIPETKKQIGFLKENIKILDQAYKNGKISLKDYKKATTAINDEIKKLSTTSTTTVIPAVKEISETIINTVIPAMRQLPGVAWNTQEEVKSAFYNTGEKIKEKTKEATETITIYFKSMFEHILDFTRDLADGFASVFVDILGITESITYQMKEFDNSYWENAMQNAEEAYEGKKTLLEQQLEDAASYYEDLEGKLTENYEKRKEWIEATVKDEEKKQEMLLKLEQKHQHDLEKARADQLQKEQDLQDKLVKLEEDHQTESERIRTEEDAAREQHAIDEEERQNTLWNKVKIVFGQAVESMLQTWMTDFIQKIFLSITDVAGSLVKDLGSAFKTVKDGAVDTGTKVGSALSGIGKTIAGIGTGIATLITTLATAIATAAKTLAAAAPALMVVLGIALAAYAGFKLISSLFKKAAKTGTLEALLKDISYIQLAAMLDKIDEANYFLSEMFPKFDYGNHQLELIVGITGKIRDGVSDVIRAIKAIPGAQHGAIVKTPRLIMAGESGPEAIIPLNKPGAIQNIIQDTGRKQPFINNYIAPVLNITAMDAIGVREFMREKGLPEIIEAINVNYKGSKTRLKEAQGN